MGTPNGYWVVYILTKSGNQTQIQSVYSYGGGAAEEVIWLDFYNRTAVYHYIGCTPSEPGCTLDGFPFVVLNDTIAEYGVKVDCPFSA